MKNIREFFGITAVLALCALGGCGKSLESAAAPITEENVNSITITNIPPKYRSMEIRIMSDIDPYPGIEVACGYNEISKGKAKIPLLDQNMEDWTGSGEFFIIMDLDKVYAYTDGNLVPPMDNIKRYTFKNSGVEIDFGRFKTYDEESSKPYQLTITDITEYYDGMIGTATVYSADSAVITEGSARISDNTAKIDLYVDDLFHSGWKGGVPAVLTFLISGTHYVYTGNASLDSAIGEGTWGKAPKYKFEDTPASVSFTRFKTNEEIYLTVEITITGLNAQYNGDHLSVICSRNQGYDQYSTIRGYDDISSGSAAVKIYSVPSASGPLYIFLIVKKDEKYTVNGVEFTKTKAVAAYKSKAAKNIVKGLMLGINDDFEATGIPETDDEGD